MEPQTANYNLTTKLDNNLKTEKFIFARIRCFASYTDTSDTIMIFGYRAPPLCKFYCLNLIVLQNVKQFKMFFGEYSMPPYESFCMVAIAVFATTCLLLHLFYLTWHLSHQNYIPKFHFIIEISTLVYWYKTDSGDSCYFGILFATSK